MKRCTECYPDNDGGLWCYKHKGGVRDIDCRECQREKVRLNYTIFNVIGGLNNDSDAKSRVS